MTSLRETTPATQGDTGQPVPAAAPTVDHIIGAPLPQLLAENNAQIVDTTSIDDRRFFGWLVEKRSGEIILAMPVGRDPLERDCSARMLLAHLHGLPTDRFPDVIETTTITDVVKNGVDSL